MYKCISRQLNKTTSNRQRYGDAHFNQTPGLFMVFMQYLSTILNYENWNMLVLSGRLFYCKKISFWPAKTSFQSALAHSRQLSRTLYLLTTYIYYIIYYVYIYIYIHRYIALFYVCYLSIPRSMF